MVAELVRALTSFAEGLEFRVKPMILRIDPFRYLVWYPALVG